jgi:hypothetical protein
VLLTPSASQARVGVSLDSDALSISGQSRILANLEYLIDPPPPIIDDFEVSLSATTPVFPGFARITTEICAGDLFANSCRSGAYRVLEVFHGGAGNPENDLFDRVTFPSVFLVDVRTRIDMAANGASSQIDGFEQGSTPIPEPSTTVLAVAGGLALLAWRRCRS